MLPRRGGRGCREATELESRINRIERILEGLVQLVQDAHNNNNHDNAPQQPAMPMPGVEMMNHTTIKQFQQLKPPTFYGTPNPMATESWLLEIERVFEVLPCIVEQKVIFATFTFEEVATAVAMTAGMEVVHATPGEQRWPCPRVRGGPRYSREGGASDGNRRNLG
ncbi:hypothetical protein Acr_00g0086420 [Actinidia rufa]|uniref:Uncharacterized protein n=1 Tax=Actinidia rufa TaxID=165716 RepID=A0A7J0DYA3_9ERIC|nr:hypothetical protein Acr_00g0086420 [Actinidia rufa]